MSSAHILELILDKYSMADLLEKLEPYITMEDFVDCMQPLIDDYFFEAFEDEIEQYYGEDDE